MIIFLHNPYSLKVTTNGPGTEFVGEEVKNALKFDPVDMDDPF